METIKGDQLSTIKSLGLQRLFERMWIPMRREAEFTCDDYYTLFVPAQYRAPLKIAASVANIAYPTLRFPISWRGHRLDITCRAGKHAPILIKDPEIQTDAPAELVEKVTTWVADLYKLRVDFGRVFAVVSALAHNCTTLGQVNYFWPQIVPLVELSEIPALSAKLAAARPPKTMPALPVGLRKACRLAAATVTSALLLPAEQDTTWNTYLVIDIATPPVREPVREPDLEFIMF